MEHGTVLAQVPPAAGSALPDLELVRRVQAGERALFELLIRRHNPRVYRAIRALLRDEAEVEDAMQQTYLLAFARLGEFAGAAAFSTWLTRIALNEALGRLRRSGKVERLDAPEAEDEAPGPPDRSPEDRAAAGEAMAFLQRALDRLPPAHRVVFMLREVEELSTAEAAEALGISAVLVKVRLHRARRALREVLAAASGQAYAEAFPFLAPRCDRIVAAVMPRVTEPRS
ncbi:RNA polymerase sigma factor [Anaeromyxobacter terrae]|uniref:RNA polymerase sigma factor n=1 Tax=Anaeromyxobacter terrae TaxID=2925406 RepID=UPI001F563F8E|nr:RNA polymerase sigma factor [Anaeromyxobacter sp. SG22]